MVRGKIREITWCKTFHFDVKATALDGCLTLKALQLFFMLKAKHFDLAQAGAASYPQIRLGKALRKAWAGGTGGRRYDEPTCGGGIGEKEKQNCSRGVERGGME